MRKQILTVFITMVATLLLFGGRGPHQVTSAGQTATSKSDLITNMRKDVNLMHDAFASFKGHKAEYDVRNFSFVDGDFTGANAGITASQFTQAVVDFNTIYNAVYAGGTISAGVIPNVYKIK